MNLFRNKQEKISFILGSAILFVFAVLLVIDYLRIAGRI